MRALRWLTAALLLGAAACSELDEIAAGRCGNGVVEPGEDCDGPAGGSACGASTDPDPDRRCGLLCAAGECPAGFRCGGDGICRAPSGVLDLDRDGRVLRTVGATSLTSGDLDADGVQDVIAVDPFNAEVGVLFAPGLAGSTLVTAPVEALREVPPLVARLNFLDDRTDDLALPRELGGPQVLLGGPGRALSATVGRRVPLGAAGTAVRLVAVPFPTSSGSALLLDIGGVLLAIDFRSPDEPPTTLLPPEAAGIPAVPATPVADLDGDGLLDLLLPLPEADHVALLSGDGTGAFGAAIDLPLGGGVTPAAGYAVGVGDVTGDGRVDLLLPVIEAGALPADSSVRLLRGCDPNVGVCGAPFDPPEPVRFEIPPDLGADPSGFFPTPAQVEVVADLDGDARLDLITTDAPFPAFAPGFVGAGYAWRGQPDGSFLLSNVPRAGFDALPGTIRVTDLNRDGRIDFVGAGLSDAEIEVQLGDGQGRFGAFSVPTGAPPRDLAVGDYNGDGLPDVAAILADLGEDGLASADDLDRIGVLYGQAGGIPAAPVLIPTFEHASSLASLPAFFDVRADLIAMLEADVAEGGATVPELAFLQGTSQKYLLSPLELEDGAAVASAVARVGTETPELAVVALVGEDTQQPELRLQHRRVDERGAALLVRSQRLDVDPALEGALSALADVDGDDRPDLVALLYRRDGTDDGLLLVARDFFATDEAAVETTPLVGVGGLFSVPSLVTADLDGDGRDEVVVGHASFGAGDGAPALERFDAAAGAPTPRTGTPFFLLVRGLALVGDPAGGSGALMVAGLDGLYSVGIGRDGAFAEPAFVAPGAAPVALDDPSFEGSPYGALVAADVDGDGLEDLVASYLFEEVQIFRQRSARELLGAPTAAAR